MLEDAVAERATRGEIELRLSELLAGLSHALDITEGQPRGHAERSCVIGMRLAEALELDDDDALVHLLRAVAQGRRAVRRTRPRWPLCSALMTRP